MNRKDLLIKLRYLDLSIMLIIIALGVISYIAISSTKADYPAMANRQIMWYVLGFAVLMVSLLIDYHRFRQYAFWFYGFGILLLLLLYVPGIGIDPERTNGARSWMSFGSFQFQPSELMKLFVTFALAKVLSDSNEVKIKSWRTIVKIALVFSFPFLIILKQPDLGTALVFLGILASMLLVAGLDWRIILVLVLIVVLTVASVFWLYFYHMPILEKVLEPHQINRISSFLDPTSDIDGNGWQIVQGMIAIGSGQLLGKGYLQGTQTQGNFVPYNYNDFVFTVIAEEFGFVGASVLLCLFIYLIYRMVHIALAAQDFYGTYLVAGVIGMLVFQIYQNIGMTVGLMPVTGINLPFISYGGSSLVSTMLAIGLVLNVGMRRKKILFYNQD